MFFRNSCTPSTRKILIKKGNIDLVSSGFKVLRENRLKYVNNTLIGYLNINSLRNKIVDLRKIILELSLDYLVLSEKKFNQGFPAAQFYIKGYEERARRDRDKHGGGLIEFVKNGFISKRLAEYETRQSESICSEFIIASRKWICLNIYRPSNSNNMNTFKTKKSGHEKFRTKFCPKIITSEILCCPKILNV